jgi:hypothetical protein
MKRVKYLAAALPAAVGLAAPMTAAAATTAAATVPTAHGKKVAYPRGSHHQQVMRNALSGSSISSTTSAGATPRTSKRCATGHASCFSVVGAGQYLSKLSLSNWPNKNGGKRTGFIKYDSSGGHTFPDFRTRTKSEPAGAPYSFTWNTQCHLPHPGNLIGTVGGHPNSVSIGIDPGHTAGPQCSGTTI